jgi:hypothetical protein
MADTSVFSHRSSAGGGAEEVDIFPRQSLQALGFDFLRRGQSTTHPCGASVQVEVMSCGLVQAIRLDPHRGRQLCMHPGCAAVKIEQPARDRVQALRIDRHRGRVLSVDSGRAPVEVEGFSRQPIETVDLSLHYAGVAQQRAVHGCWPGDEIGELDVACTMDQTDGYDERQGADGYDEVDDLISGDGLLLQHDRLLFLVRIHWERLVI